MLLSMFLFNQFLLAAPKQHVVTFGRWTITQAFDSEESSEMADVKIRPLLVDGRAKEVTFGAVHDITDQVFAVRRIYRINDSLPEETGTQWRWQRGGWILVNRISGKVQPLILPEFDLYYSGVAWFRDYAAYCGFSDDGKKLFAVVARIGKRKPLLKKDLADSAEHRGTVCQTPSWQRSPPRVTFSTANQPKFSYTVRGGTLSLATEDLAPEDEISGEE